MEKVIDILWNIEELVRVETERRFEPSHFVNSEGSSMYVGCASLGGSDANYSANVEECGLVARSSGLKGVYDGWFALAGLVTKTRISETYQQHLCLH